MAVPQPHEEASNLVLLRRSGRPPLRLRATLLFRHVVALGHGDDQAEIVLWRRPAGGFAVSAARDGGAIAYHMADTAKTLDGAFDLAEASVADLAPTPDRVPPRKKRLEEHDRAALPRTLAEAAQARTRVQRLIGRATFDWLAAEDARTAPPK